MTSQPRDQRNPRPFKSAEKPVSLYPLSYKQALEALLQTGPLGADAPTGQAAKKPAAPPAKS